MIKEYLSLTLKIPTMSVKIWQMFQSWFFVHQASCLMIQFQCFVEDTIVDTTNVIALVTSNLNGCHILQFHLAEFIQHLLPSQIKKMGRLDL